MVGRIRNTPQRSTSPGGAELGCGDPGTSSTLLSYHYDMIMKKGRKICPHIGNEIIGEGGDGGKKSILKEIGEM